MKIVDAHLDIAWNAIGLGRDPTLPVELARAREQGSALAEREGEVTVSLAELRDGAQVVFGTLFVLPNAGQSTMEGMCYETAEQAHQQARWQLGYYRQLEQDGQIQIVTSRRELRAALEGGQLALALLMEGADPVRDPGELASWYADGLRILGPAWQRTRYSGGTLAPGPLSALGVELVDEMRRLGIALDVSHMAEESFWQTLGRFDGPVLASHSNCKALVPTDRQLSDEMIRALVERDAVIGVLPLNEFLVPDWDKQKGSVGIEALLRHIEHICRIAGDRRHIGLGSDLDGGFGRASIPRELDRWSDLALIGAALGHAGWSEQEVAGFLGGNWLRWLERALPD